MFSFSHLQSKSDTRIPFCHLRPKYVMQCKPSQECRLKIAVFKSLKYCSRLAGQFKETLYIFLVFFYDHNFVSEVHKHRISRNIQSIFSQERYKKFFNNLFLISGTTWFVLVLKILSCLKKYLLAHSSMKQSKACSQWTLLTDFCFFTLGNPDLLSHNHIVYEDFFVFVYVQMAIS